MGIINLYKWIKGITHVKNDIVYKQIMEIIFIILNQMNLFYTM